MIDNGDDSEPHLRWRIIIISTIILCFLLVGFADAMKPISINDCVGVKCVVKKVDEKFTISGWFKPSVESSYPYKWYYRTWKNECPYCGHKLSVNPKGVPERELTCFECDADYCGVTGYVKNGRFNKRLTRGE